MGDLLDNPNQQVVRADGSGPGVGQEGTEGSAAETSAADNPSLDEMTKDQLLAYGQELGISPMNAAMNKDEIRAAIDATLAG